MTKKKKNSLCFYFFVPRLTKWGRGTIEFATVCPSICSLCQQKRIHTITLTCQIGWITTIRSRRGTLELHVHWFVLHAQKTKEFLVKNLITFYGICCFTRRKSPSKFIVSSDRIQNTSEVPNVLSRCHTERRTGTRPPFFLYETDFLDFFNFEKKKKKKKKNWGFFFIFFFLFFFLKNIYIL